VDTPEIEIASDGRRKEKNKYLSAHGARPRLYFPPTAFSEDLTNRYLPIIITEGEKKTLALARLALFRRPDAAARWLAIGIAGIWNWRGTVEIITNAQGERVPVKGPIPDLDRIDWKGRTAYLLFDCDVHTNPHVLRARRYLAVELRSRGAVVILVDLPKHDDIKGIDDYLAHPQRGPEAAERLIIESIEPEKVSGFTVEESGHNWGVRWISRAPAKDPDTGKAAKDKEGNILMEEEAVFVCSPLYVVAQTRDDRSRYWGRQLRWRDNDNVDHQWAMPMAALAGDCAELRSRLLSEGLIVGTDKRSKDLLQKYLLAARPTRRLTCTAKTGWHGRRFVLPDTTIAPIDEEQIMYQTESALHHDYRVAGSLHDWTSSVSALCGDNTRLEFGVAAAFAACLLGPLGEESGGFHLLGSSSSGKTTMLVASGSVWGGGGKNGFIKTWKSTTSGIEVVAQRHHDTLLPLDEIGQVDPRDVGDIAYQLANGQGKLRSGKSVELRETLTWNILFLSSGEVSLAQHMQAANRKARGGQMVRLIEIPGDPGAGVGIFENLHGHENGATFAGYLSANATRFYGTAIRSFLERIVTELDRVCQFVRDRQSAFVRSNVPEKAAGEIHRGAQRFGVVAAAGELATLLNITGWQEGRATEAARSCFEAWLAHRGTIGGFDENAALNHIRGILAKHGGSRFQEKETGVVANRLGWHLTKDEYLFYPEVFKTEVCSESGFAYEMVIKSLIKAGVIKRDANHVTSKRQLPDGTRTRFIVVDARILVEDESEKSEL
jgi:uncharacterized protein (DUF927 family)